MYPTGPCSVLRNSLRTLMWGRARVWTRLWHLVIDIGSHVRDRWRFRRRRDIREKGHYRAGLDGPLPDREMGSVLAGYRGDGSQPNRESAGPTDPAWKAYELRRRQRDRRRRFARTSAWNQKSGR